MGVTPHRRLPGWLRMQSLSAVDRAVRDQMTIAAHAIASARNLEPAGRVLLGLPAEVLWPTNLRPSLPGTGPANCR